tara:strand:+ start:1015 stop:1452 length:438 start_codon:yes stop_codon:yes gene_type:complete
MNCNICFEKKQSNEIITLDCSHYLCTNCLDKWKEKAITCPYCRAPFVKNEITKWPLIEVYGSDFRPALNHMYHVITLLNLWDFIRQNPPDVDTGYMFSNAEEIYQIGNHSLVEMDGHSGATFAFGMRIMQKIAHQGWDNFVKEYS